MPLINIASCRLEEYTKYCKLRLGNTKEKYGAQYMYYSLIL